MHTSHRPRVLLVLNTELGVFGGTEVNALSFASHLAVSGWSPTILQVGQDALAGVRGYPGLDVWHASSEAFAHFGFSSWLGLLRRLRPQLVIHVKNWYQSKNPSLDTSCLLLGIRRVIWENHPVPVLREGYWGRFPFATWWLRRMAGWLHYGRASHRIAISEAVRRPLVEQLRVPEADIELVYPGIDLLRHSKGSERRNAVRKDWQLDAELFVVGAVGRLVAHKGFDFVLRLVAEMRREFGGKVACVIAGRGPEEESLRRLSAELEIEDVVRFPGWVTSAEDAWSAIDVSLLPSTNEGLGLAVIESAAAGCIPLASDCEGMREVLYDELYDLRLPVGDLHAWSSKLRELRELTELERRQLNAKVRDVLTKRFNPDTQWSAMASAVIGPSHHPK